MVLLLTSGYSLVAQTSLRFWQRGAESIMAVENPLRAQAKSGDEPGTSDLSPEANKRRDSDSEVHLIHPVETLATSTGV